MATSGYMPGSAGSIFWLEGTGNQSVGTLVASNCDLQGSWTWLGSTSSQKYTVDHVVVSNGARLLFPPMRGAPETIVDHGVMQLVVDGTSAFVGDFKFSQLTLRHSAQLVGWNLSSLAITESWTVLDTSSVSTSAAVLAMSVSVGELSFLDESTWNFYGKVSVSVGGNATIDANVLLSGDGGGYGSDRGACPIGSPGTGGSLGGLGSLSTAGGAAMVPCTGYMWPSTMGAGGVSWSQPGGAGGAALAVIANSSDSSLALNGIITVNGRDGFADVYGAGGGGSGGSIAIDAWHLVGSGTLLARGGSGGMSVLSIVSCVCVNGCVCCCRRVSTPTFRWCGIWWADLDRCCSEFCAVVNISVWWECGWYSPSGLARHSGVVRWAGLVQPPCLAPRRCCVRYRGRVSSAIHPDRR